MLYIFQRFQFEISKAASNCELYFPTGSTQDRSTGAVRPVVFLPGRVNGQYIIEGLSSGFMFVLGGLGIILMDLALDKNRAKSIKISFASTGVSFVVIAYVMSMLFIRIKIPAYLR